jgi:spore germination protein GerM
MKKSTRIILVSILLIAILITIYYFIKNSKEKIEIEEYTPEVEITEEQERNTIITLYYLDKETAELLPEARLIDAKELLENPYSKLVSLLLEKPRNEKLIKIIDEDYELENTIIESGIVKINLKTNGQIDIENNKEKFIQAMKNTLTQLNEVNDIIIFINGEKIT